MTLYLAASTSSKVLLDGRYSNRIKRLLLMMGTVNTGESYISTIKTLNTPIESTENSKPLAASEIARWVGYIE